MTRLLERFMAGPSRASTFWEADVADGEGRQDRRGDPRRRDGEREKGRVAFSTETVAGAMLLTLLLSALVTGPMVVEAAGELVVDESARGARSR